MKPTLYFGANRDTPVRACLCQVRRLPHVVKVVVYGSYAKKTNRTDSDLDVAVFFDLPESAMLECYRTLVRICRIPEMDIQIQAFPAAELTSPCGIIEEILTFGIEWPEKTD